MKSSVQFRIQYTFNLERFLKCTAIFLKYDKSIDTFSM